MAPPSVDPADPWNIKGQSPAADSSDPWNIKAQQARIKPPVSSPSGGLAPTPQAGNAPAVPQPEAPRPAGKPGTSALEALADWEGTLSGGINALQRGEIGKFGQMLGKRDVHGIAQEYGFGSPGQLKYGAGPEGYKLGGLVGQWNHHVGRNADPYSVARQKSPALNAVSTAVESIMADPVNLVLPAAGTLAEKGLRAGAGAAAKVPGVARAAQAVADRVGPDVNRFYGVRKAGGEEGEAAMRNLIGSASEASTKGMQQGIDLFAPQAGKALTREEKIEVVRRSQGLPGKEVVIPGKGGVDRSSALNLPETTGKVGRSDWAAFGKQPLQRSKDLKRLKFQLPKPVPRQEEAMQSLRDAGYSEGEAQRIAHTALAKFKASGKRGDYGAIIETAVTKQLRDPAAMGPSVMKAPSMRGARPAADAFTTRGKAVREALKGMDAAQMAAHPDLLPEGRTFDKETFFPMAGQYAKKDMTDEVGQFLDSQRGGTGGGVRTAKGTAREGGPSKKFADLDKTLLADKVRVAQGKEPLLRPDFDPPQAIGRHLAQRGRNAAIEQGIQKLPKSLAARIEYERPEGSGQFLTPKRLKIEDFAHFGPDAEKQFAKATEHMTPITPPGHVPGDEVVKLLGSSPSAAQRTFHPEAIKLMREAGAPQEEATGAGAFFGMLNKLQRIGIITNPIVHVFWNLGGNYLGAKGDPTMLGYVASGKGWDEAQTWDKLAEENGAHAHMGMTSMLGGDPARLLTSEGGNPLERMDRAMTRGWNANQRLVFDTMERRFSTTLFHQKVMALQAQGATKEQALMRAGMQVRKTFGDYANVAQANMTKPEWWLNKAFFFYPWLKTIMPFVARTAVDNPSWTNAPVRAVRAWNQGMGDPNAESKSNAIDLGKWGGQERYLSAPFPQRNLEDLLDIGRTGSGGLGANLKAATDLATNHAGLPAGLAIDALSTVMSSAKPPGGINRHILFDKAAPGDVQAKQMLGGLGERVVPPMLQNLPALAKGDMSPLLGGLGGTTYARPDVVQQKQTSMLRAGMLRAIHQANAIGDKKLADDLYRLYTKIGQSMGLP